MRRTQYCSYDIPVKNTVSKSNHGGTFKIYFYFYKGMTRLTHQEMITTAKTVCYSVTMGRRHVMSRRAIWGSTRAGQEAEGARRKHGLGRCLSCSILGKVRQSRISRNRVG